MYLIKTRVDRSAIEGSGVIAMEDIPEGTIIWKWFEGFDRMFSVENLRNLPETIRSYARRYGYMNDGKLILLGDNAVFENHSDTPNTAMLPDGSMIARRSIKKDEEITSDYRQFAEEMADGLKFYDLHEIKLRMAS